MALGGRTDMEGDIADLVGLHLHLHHQLAYILAQVGQRRELGTGGGRRGGCGQATRRAGAQDSPA
jgi:hypothetical protein